MPDVIVYIGAPGLTRDYRWARGGSYITPASQISAQSTLYNCAWDAAKLAATLSEGAGCRAYLVAGASDADWKSEQPGAELFESSQWSTAAFFKRYARDIATSGNRVAGIGTRGAGVGVADVELEHQDIAVGVDRSVSDAEDTLRVHPKTTACAAGERRTKRGKDAGRPNSSAIWPTEDAATRSVRRRQTCAGVFGWTLSNYPRTR